MRIGKISTWPVIAFLFIIIFSCRKDNTAKQNGETQGIHRLNTPSYDESFKVRQAVPIYDSTVFSDSSNPHLPPLNRNYKWIISADTSCYKLSGGFQHGMGDILFKCSGTYQIYAQIYDSLSTTLLGNTDTIQIKVTTDTLQQYQPVQANDTLKIMSDLIFIPSYPDTEYVDYIMLTMSTTRTYEYYSSCNQIDYTSNISDDNAAFVFSDSVRLSTYPFASGYGIKDNVRWIINIDLTIGVPLNISYTWLGVTHSGVITLTSKWQYTLTWKN